MTPRYLAYLTAVTIAVVAVFWLLAYAYAGTTPNYWSLGLHLVLGLSGVLAAAWVVTGMNGISARVRRHLNRERDTAHPTRR